MKLFTIVAGILAATATAAPIAKCAINGEAVDCDLLTEGMLHRTFQFIESKTAIL
jgi:hypothetical protein